jgi:excisionase family DNA binding protein
MQKEWYSVEDIANELGVSVEAVRGWIRAKQLIAYKVGKEYRIRSDDYRRFLSERRTDQEDTTS